MSKTLNLQKLRVTVLAVLTGCVSLALASCGLIPLSAEEKAYIQDCGQVQANFSAYVSTQEDFYNAEYNDSRFDWQFWPDSYAVTNAGQDSRNAASNAITNDFSWVRDLVDKEFQKVSKKQFLAKSVSDWSTEALESSLIEGFYQQLTKGTSFNVTADGLANLDDDPMNLDINLVSASFSPSDRFKNCDEALNLKDESALATISEDYGIYGNGVDLRSVLDTSIALWGCEKFGAGHVSYGKGWAKCAGSDFDSSKYASTSCTGKLQVTINSAIYGQCGKLRFEIFQADQNTGDCLALGWWTDKNGVQQVGAFRFCGLEDGSTYDTNVSVGTEFSYTNNFGVDKTVIGFNSQ